MAKNVELGGYRQEQLDKMRAFYQKQIGVMETILADESSKGSILLSACERLEYYTIKLFDIENVESTETKADIEIHELRKENHLLKSQLNELRKTYNVPGSADKLDATALFGPEQK